MGCASSTPVKDDFKQVGPTETTAPPKAVDSDVPPSSTVSKSDAEAIAQSQHHHSQPAGQQEHAHEAPHTPKNDGQKAPEEYEKLKVLGSGASCDVYIGKRKSDGKLFAVKSLSKADKNNLEAFKELFESEIGILRKLKHPNILQFVEAFETRNNFNLVTVLCTGGELFDRIVSESKFSERTASRYAKQMIAAVAHCHSKGVVHRDLKPENFVFESKEKDSPLKLIDFGCALLVRETDVVKDVVSSLYYVAPEVLDPEYKRTGRTWKASDMWSIGVIVFLLLHGYAPFNGTPDEIERRIRKGKYTFGHNIPLSLSSKEFVSRLLTYDPYKRMTAAEALEHPWIKDLNKQSDTPLPPKVVKSLTDFRAQVRLKKAVGKVLAGHMSPDDAAELEMVFKKFDKNGDGALDAEEIADMLKSIGKNSVEAKAYIEQLDNDGDGQLDIHEFKAGHVIANMGLDEKAIRKSFQIFDKDGDGFVTHEEIEQICSGMSTDLAKDLISEVDKNGDGKINFNEWLAAMRARQQTREKMRAQGAGKSQSAGSAVKPNNARKASYAAKN
jgi:calcium-dependent protein kinase